MHLSASTQWLADHDEQLIWPVCCTCLAWLSICGVPLHTVHSHIKKTADRTLAIRGPQRLQNPRP